MNYKCNQRKRPRFRSIWNAAASVFHVRKTAFCAELLENGIGWGYSRISNRQFDRIFLQFGQSHCGIKMRCYDENRAREQE